jgi:hypothetical protein
MESTSNRALYFKVKYGSVKYAKLIILARRKKYHTLLYKNHIDWLYSSCPFSGHQYETDRNRIALKSWHALRLIERLAS